jgi:hypothetical protein
MIFTKLFDLESDDEDEEEKEGQKLTEKEPEPCDLLTVNKLGRFLGDVERGKGNPTDPDKKLGCFR